MTRDQKQNAMSMLVMGRGILTSKDLKDHHDLKYGRYEFMQFTSKPFKLSLRDTSKPRLNLGSDLLGASLEHYEGGRYVDAFEIIRSAGCMQDWQGVEAQVFGFRLANNLGASRLAALLVCRAWREHPHHPQAAVHFGYYLQSRAGALKAWRHTLSSEPYAAQAPTELADLKALRARVASSYRDFATAWSLWNEAESIGGAHKAWLQVERAGILLDSERRDAALDALDESLLIQPWFRPAVQLRARVLHLLGRDEAAVEYLNKAVQHLQSCAVVAQLMILKHEVDDAAGMEALADQYGKLALLAEEPEKRWVAARRVDLLALKGDFARAAEIAATLPDMGYQRMAKRMSQPGVRNERKRLPLRPVIQNHNTCVPATLAAIAGYWGKPVAMSEIVEAICYDGTYDHSERAWAEGNGFATREFTVTHEAARALIDAGLPFVLHTVEVDSAHSQAVIGYDLLRESIFIQDPGEPHYREAEAEAFFANYKLNGPRGMVIVPVDQAALLHGLELPDAEIYDLNHAFHKALASFDRSHAEIALESMAAQMPEHRLTLLARLSLASFDGNEPLRLERIEALLALFPEDPRLLNWRYESLCSLGARSERLELLRSMTRASSPSHGAMHTKLVQELMNDARDWSEARRLAWRAHSLQPSSAPLTAVLADVCRRAENAPTDEWLTFLRFAAAMADKTEGLAQTWFSHAQSQGRGDQALEWLRRRLREHGAGSTGPAITLSKALDFLNQPESAEVLRQALQAHPKDGGLLLELVRHETRSGNQSEAERFHSLAWGQCQPSQWRRASLYMKRRFGLHEEELEAWREILRAEPLALDAHAALVRDLVATCGLQAALVHLKEVRARFPHHYGLAQLQVSWLREGAPGPAEEELRRLIASHPEDAWAHRELALTLNAQSMSVEALEPARHAVAIAPDESASHAILAVVLSATADKAGAEASFRKSICLDVNYPASFSGLLELQSGSEDRRAALAFIHGEMVRQVLNGNALHAYRDLAFIVLSHDELLAQLQAVQSARPDLWEAWSVLIRQLQDCGRHEEALALAGQAAQKFPLVPAAWRDLAEVQRGCGQMPEAIQSAHHSLQLNPDWPDAWCDLAASYEATGDSRASLQTLRNAHLRLPLDMGIRFRLASLLWRLDEREEAWQTAEKAAQEDPGQDWAWNCLQTWAPPMRREDALIQLAQGLTRDRPKEPRSWFTLARLLPLEKMPEIFSALDEAARLNPRLVDVYDLRMELLARLGRFDEAARVPLSGPWQTEEIPFNLAGRHAWLKAAQGKFHEAMSQMRVVLERHQDYAWGWDAYATWAEQTSDLKEWKRAADQLIRLAPRAPGPWCTAADALLKMGDREKGVEHLRQALRADPTSPYAAQRLLGLHWEKGDLDALAQEAALVADNGTSLLIKRVHLMLASAKRGDTAKARADLDWLAMHPDMMGPLLRLILDFFRAPKNKLGYLLDEALDAAVEADTIGPAFATLWVERETQLSRWHCWSKLARWLPRLGHRLDTAICHYLDTIGDARAADPHVISFTKDCGVHLRERGELWGKVSYALTASSSYRACADWQWPDYQRPDAEAWMLWNLTISMRHLMRPHDAAESSLHVVTQGLRDNTWAHHATVAAHALASKGDYEEARRLLNHDCDVNGVSHEFRLLALIARAFCDVLTSQGKDSRYHFNNFLSASKALIHRQYLTPQGQRDYTAAVEKMKAHTGAPVRFWQRAKPGETVHTDQGGRQVSVGAIMIGIWIALLMLRNCDSTTRTTPAYFPSSSPAPVTPIFPTSAPQAPPPTLDFQPRPPAPANFEDLLRRYNLPPTASPPPERR